MFAVIFKLRVVVGKEIEIKSLCSHKRLEVTPDLRILIHVHAYSSPGHTLPTTHN